MAGSASEDKTHPREIIGDPTTRSYALEALLLTSSYDVTLLAARSCLELTPVPVPRTPAGIVSSAHNQPPARELPQGPQLQSGARRALGVAPPSRRGHDPASRHDNTSQRQSLAGRTRKLTHSYVVRRTYIYIRIYSYIYLYLSSYKACWRPADRPRGGDAFGDRYRSRSKWGRDPASRHRETRRRQSLARRTGTGAHSYAERRIPSDDSYTR